VFSFRSGLTAGTQTTSAMAVGGHDRFVYDVANIDRDIILDSTNDWRPRTTTRSTCDPSILRVTKPVDALIVDAAGDAVLTGSAGNRINLRWGAKGAAFG
jgi:hypothetical protein